MKILYVLGVGAGLAVLPALTSLDSSDSSDSSVERDAGFDTQQVVNDIKAHFERFSGPVAEQSVELWDQYFLVSPNIGNKHGPDVEIGWEAFHEGNIAFFDSPAAGDGAFRFEELQVYPINADVAWVRGDFVAEFGGQTTTSVFYDTVVRTEQGWRVILSYVEPPRPQG